MPIITANIGGNEYSFACADGQEQRFLSLANKLNTRINNITNSNPKASEMRVLALACLLMEDEIDDLKKAKASEEKELSPKDQQNLVATMDSVSEYVEKLAQRIELM